MVAAVETMAYAGELPWHGLGTPVSNDISVDDMLKISGLDWEVVEIPSFIEHKEVKIATGQKSLVRETDGSILTNVGKGWHPVQNHEAFEFFREYVEAGGMEMHTAGSLNDGRNVWVLAKVNESFDLLGDDQIDSYLLFSNPHKYGQSLNVRFTPIRVVCNNTLSMSLNADSANSVKLNHRSKFDADKVKEMMGLAKDKLAAYKEVAEFLASKRYNDDNVVQFFNAAFPHTYGPKKGVSVSSIDELSANGKNAANVYRFKQPGAEKGEGTFWELFNTVTFMTDHVIGRTADSRLNSAWFGANRTRKINALNTAVEMAQAA